MIKKKKRTTTKNGRCTYWCHVTESITSPPASRKLQNQNLLCYHSILRYTYIHNICTRNGLVTALGSGKHNLPNWDTTNFIIGTIWPKTLVFWTSQCFLFCLTSSQAESFLITCELLKTLHRGNTIFKKSGYSLSSYLLSIFTVFPRGWPISGP